MSGLVALVSACVALAVVPGEGGSIDTYRAIDGSVVTLTAPTRGAAVLAFYSTECPVSNYYSTELSALAGKYPASKLRVVGVCVDPDTSTEALAAHAREYRLGFPSIADRGGVLAKRFGVRVTPEVIVLDDAGSVAYQGRVNDQYLSRRQKTAAPRTHELADAVAALMAGHAVEVRKTEAVGCPLPTPRTDAEGTISYSGNVASILNQHCVECHRAGSYAPFALDTYEQARKRAADLASVTADRLMPPWRARPGFGPAFQHDRSMTSDEIATLAAWADAGAPEGDSATTPAVPVFADGWKLGTPDLVIEMPEEFEVPASGEDIYRCFVVKTNLPEDVYISGIEYQPGNPRVVHHILGYVDVTEGAREKDEAEPGAGYTCFGGPGVEIKNDLGGWAPGVEASVLPEGIGRALPKGSYVILQVHYHPNGKAERDRSRVGLTFAKTPVSRSFHWSFALNDGFEITPGDANHEVRAERVIPVDVDALSVAPHMHMLGKDMTMWAELPSGERIDLIEIDHWDFKWQAQYFFREPIRLPKGTRLKVVSHFDNSRENPANPRRDNPIPVRWGEGTHDEMCIGFIGLVKADQDLTQPGEQDDLRELLDRRRR